MKRTLMLISILVLVALATACSATVFDGFEGYTPTASWNPVKTVDNGWQKMDSASPTMIAEITATGGYLGSQGLTMGGDWVSGLAWNYMVPNKNLLPQFGLKYVFRIHPNADPLIQLNGLTTPYTAGYIQHTLTDRRLINGGTPDTTPLPGDALVAGTWYSAEWQFDYASLPYKTMRARLGVAGGAQYDWTPWVRMIETGQPTQWIIQGVNVDYDNMEVVPEPGSLLALASGLTGFIAFARRRRS